MASVWVPFTSESKEAIADYDEIQKEITLALRECGRRLGLFLRRRERAASEFRRRNIFELYIEEVVDACDRLKGGTLPKAKLKSQLQKIATSRTGGLKTDEALGKSGGGPEGLPHSIIVTAEGVEGDLAVASQVEADATASPAEPDLLGDAPPAATPPARSGKARPSKTGSGSPTKQAASQMPLFDKQQKSGKSKKRAHPAPRGKK
jgi:DNA topoisomerase-6 subunit B